MRERKLMEREAELARREAELDDEGGKQQRLIGQDQASSGLSASCTSPSSLKTRNWSNDRRNQRS